eukprot:1267896-Amphidinium_carterae.1
MDPGQWRTRVMIAVDSQVAVWAMRKGRSSSKALNHVLQTMLGETLSTGVRMCPVWICTEKNPADAPTRRRHIPAPVEPDDSYFVRRDMTLREHSWTLDLNEFEWQRRFGIAASTGRQELSKQSPRDGRMAHPCEEEDRAFDWCPELATEVSASWWPHQDDDDHWGLGGFASLEFDATLGFPGEGPKERQEKLILGPVRQKERDKDLRVQVQPLTLKRYKARYEAWGKWLQEVSLPPALEVVRSPALDAVMTSYMQQLYNLDAPLSHGLESLAAIQLFHPHTIGALQSSWKAARQWKRTQPLSIRAPLPLSVLLAMSVTAWVQGWVRTASLMLLAFDACLRPGEVAQGLRSHLILPTDLAGERDTALFVIPDSKTASRTVQTSLGAHSYARLAPEAQMRIQRLACLAPTILRPPPHHELVATREMGGTVAKNS